MSSGTKILLRLSPIVVPVAFIVGTGLAVTLLQSLGLMQLIGESKLSFVAYRRLFADSWFGESFAYSLYVGFASALLSIVLGTVLGYFVWRLPLDLQRYGTVYKVPLILPHITVAFITMILSSRSGLIASIAYHLGLISSQGQFPQILYGGNGVGLVAAYTFKETPFVMLMVIAAYKGIDERLIVTSRNLGASKLRGFFKIVLPELYPVLSNTFIILFLYAFGAFDIPFLLSESKPQMLSIYVYNTYFKKDLALRPEVMAALMIMFLFSVVFIYVYSRVAKKLGENRRWA